ncbi:MAG: hypothetical protein ABIG63_13620 [Chloroflexota bacterium]
MSQGWVKNYRKIKDWEWYTSPNMAHLFQHLIRQANHEPQKWHGQVIERGQIVTGLHSLSQETGISVRSLRTCLERLKSTGELTRKTTNRFSIITISHYKTYQEAPNSSDKQSDKLPDKQATSKRQASDNKQECKELKNEKKEEATTTSFDIFWKQYPKKVGKGAARKVWAKLKPSETLVEKILGAVAEQKESIQWNKEGGQFIPHPATWLNQERWGDELEPLYHDPTEEEADAFFAKRKMNVGND